MKSELDALRERGEEVIRAADPASPIFTPRHAAALCGFFVEALEEQRRWMQQAVAGGGQKWATVQQLAERFGYKDASGMYRLLADIRAAGFKVRSLRADAVRGHKIYERFHIEDVEAALMSGAEAEERKGVRRK